MCTIHKGGSVLLLPVGEADSISRQRKKSLLHTEERSPDALCRGELLLLYTERRVHLFYTRHRVSPCYMYRRQTPSLYKVALSSLHIREGVPLLCVEGACSLYGVYSVSYTQRRECPSSYSMQRRECLFLTGVRLSFCYMRRRQILSLYRRENVFCRQSRECPSVICRGESVSLLYTE